MAYLTSGSRRIHEENGNQHRARRQRLLRIGETRTVWEAVRGVRPRQNPEFRAARNAEDKRIALALQIIKMREWLGMTQGDLAKAIGTRQANVRRRFDTNLTLDMLEKVARALGVKLKFNLVPEAS